MLPADLIAKLHQCATTDLVGPRDHWFNGLAGFTATVFVGLLLEFPELRYELKLIAREWIPYFRYRILTPSDHRLHAAKVLAFIGWFLIVIGVGGERYAEVRVKDLDASIQTCSDAKVTEATLEAGDAKDSAKRSQDSADAIGKQYDDLLKKYEAAERELAELRAERMPRRLSSADVAKLRQRVAAFSVKTIGVECVNTDQEGLDFEQDFVGAFRAKESPLKLDFWLVSCDEEVGPTGPNSFHPPIEIQAGSARQGDAQILRKALVEIGVKEKEIRIKPADNNNPIFLRLTVGPHAQWKP